MEIFAECANWEGMFGIQSLLDSVLLVDSSQAHVFEKKKERRAYAASAAAGTTPTWLTRRVSALSTVGAHTPICRGGVVTSRVHQAWCAVPSDNMALFRARLGVVLSLQSKLRTRPPSLSCAWRGVECASTHAPRTAMSLVRISPSLGRVSDVSGRRGVVEEMSASCCMCELTETARRRQRRLRQFLRHERLSVAMALAGAPHLPTVMEDGQGRGS